MMFHKKMEKVVHMKFRKKVPFQSSGSLTTPMFRFHFDKPSVQDKIVT